MRTFIVPSTEADYVSLGKTQHGRLFRKHILNKGKLLYPGAPGGVVDIDDAFVAKLKENFDNGVCDIVQVPLAGPKNEHSEAPDRNIGVVTDIEEGEDGKIYALIDARKHADDLGETMLGASAMMSLDYENDKTQERVGPTLLHVAVTNRPYVTGLDEYKEVIAASASADDEEPVLLTTAATEEKVVTMTREEWIAAGLSEHGVDVAALEVAAAGAPVIPDPPAAVPAGPSADVAALTKTLADTGLVQLTTGEQITGEDVVNAMAQLAQSNVALSNTVDGLVKDKAVTEVDARVSEGRILPAQRDAMLALKLTNSDLYDQIVPEKPLVVLTKEAGITPPDQKPVIDIDKEIEKYVNYGSEHQLPGLVPAKK